LVEAVRASGGETQVFFSTTNPGYTRGGHFHLRKVERFIVLEGQASIRLRRLFTDQVVEFPVTGETPAIVDMPTLWTHSITNTGDSNLMTLFYADDEFNPENPDTYWVAV
jgi:UDP-2-acetamido-2,6-beta-L-arabino-hexul-4-ose reductase